jgi:hypothetical protein
MAAKNQSKTPAKKSDEFETVARRLECDPDLSNFDKKLKQLAARKPSPRPKPTRPRKRSSV